MNKTVNVTIVDGFSCYSCGVFTIAFLVEFDTTLAYFGIGLRQFAKITDMNPQLLDGAASA